MHEWPHQLWLQRHRVPVYHEVVRNKRERSMMGAVTCKQCDGFFAAAGGIFHENHLKNAAQCAHQDCSRHRVQPGVADMPGTPESFWQIGFDDTQQEE